MILKLLTVEEGLKLAGDFPSLSYSREFFEYTENVYGLQSGFLAVSENNEIVLIFPVNFSETSLYSVHKSYTEPCFLKKVGGNVWPEIISATKKDLGFKYVHFYFRFLREPEQIKYFNKTDLSCYVLTLKENEDRESILQKFSKKTRNQVRKSEKAGFNIKIGGAGDLDAAYGLYKENMERHGTPPKSQKFFHNLLARYKDKCKMFLAYDGKVLAGVNVAVVKDDYLMLMFNFSNPEYWSQCINNFLYYKMIEQGCGQGIRYFDFGPSLNTDKGHTHFKEGFGGVKVPLVKMTVSTSGRRLKNWVEQRRYNLKIRLNKFKIT